MPMPVSATRNAIASPARESVSLSAFQPPVTTSTENETSPRSVNLNAFESRFLRTCWRRFASVTQRARQVAREVAPEAQALRVRHVLEGAVDEGRELGEADLARVHDHRARLDLREVEDVVDEHQQVGARRVDGLRELGLAPREVALGVLRELVGEDQQAVERRAQLVRHVREELGLVLRGERRAAAALSSIAWRACSISLFFVSTSTFCWARRTAFSSSCWLVWRSSSCWFWSSRRERLRLLQQVLGARVRLDRVEHDADRLGELVEERLVRRVEAVEGGQLEHGLDLALEDDRQDDEVERARPRRGPKRSGCSRWAPRSAGSCRFSQRALADEPLAEPERGRRCPGARDTRSSRRGGAPRRRRPRRACRRRRAARTPPARAPRGSAGRP